MRWSRDGDFSEFTEFTIVRASPASIVEPEFDKYETMSIREKSIIAFSQSVHNVYELMLWEYARTRHLKFHVNFKIQNTIENLTWELRIIICLWIIEVTCVDSYVP